MANEFLLEEYKMLRTKAQDVTRRIEELERNVVVACSAIFVFSVAPSFKFEHGYQFLILFFLPLCVSLVGFVRYKGLALYMKEINGYAAGLESQLGGDPGWLNYYYSKDRPYTDDHYRRFREAIWYAIIGFNFLAGAVLTYHIFNG
jgi:hypothetical protein